MSSITLITGEASSGKSTVSKLVATHFPQCFVIPVDDIREMLLSGYAVPAVDEPFPPAIIEQFRWARLAAIKMAEIYVESGIPVIIDDVCVPPMFVEHYQGLLAKKNHQIVLLKPTRQAMIERIRERAGPVDQLLESFIPLVYDSLELMPKGGWTVLDSSEWSIEDTVEQVLLAMQNHDSST